MAEVRLQIPDELVAKFQEKLGADVKATDIARDAITLYKWVVDEKASGNTITSSDSKDFKPIKQLAMTSLNNIAAPKNTQ